MKPEELRHSGDPYWVDVQKAGELLGLPDKTVLHAGPPISFDRMCLGHRRSMVNACLFEGWASTPDEALKLLESGEVKPEPAFDYATNGSGYGIITSSVPLLVIEDRQTGGVAGLFPAEGRFGGGFCGWGQYSADIAANLRWLKDTLFPPLVSVLKAEGGFPLKDLFEQALSMGDELHSSQRAMDPLFTRAIIPYILKCRSMKDELLDYFATTHRFTHNFGQAASRALLLGLEKQGIRHLMTAAGGNGVEYGIKVDGVWKIAPSPMIVGPYLTPGAKKENQLPWLGDSSVVECRGWGGTIRPINPDFGVEGRGLVINGGMMDVNGGWMGAGSTRMPVYAE